MTFELDATYENGVLKLDRPLPLAEHERVKVVVQQSAANEQTGQGTGFWETLQEVWAEQKSRGYVGTVTEYDRGDEAYEAKMREILRNTEHGNAAG